MSAAKTALPRTLALGAAALVLAAVHVALVLYAFGDTLPLPQIPFDRGDFATHAAQVRRVLEALDTYGQHWAYDVQLLAGAPNGVLFDADNKGWELWTWALVKLGVGEGRAYNSFVLAIHLAVPLVVYAAARLFALDRPAALTATGLAIMLWSFDSFTHWMWYVGTVSYGFVAYFALLPLALFYRWMEDRRPVHALGCALALAFGHLVHPYIFFILVGPMLAVYVRASWFDRSLRAVDHAITLGIAGLTLVVNGWWLRTATRFFHYILDSAYYEQSGLRFVVYDFFGLLYDSQTQGLIGPRTAVRVLALIAASLALRAWRRSRDRRRLPFMLLIVIMAAFAYLGGYTPVAQIQPYRHTLPLGFGLLIPASWWLTEVARERPWRGLQPSARALGLILVVLVVPRLARDALYFFAPSLPDRQVMDDGREIPMGALGHMLTPAYRYEGQNQWEDVIAWVTEHDDGQGRWLVQDQALGETLMARTDAQILGGFLFRNLEHSDANWFRQAAIEPPYDPERFERYLQTYAVRWVIVQHPAMKPWWDQHPRLMTRAIYLNGMVIYQVHLKTSLIRGPGRVAASINRIEVSGSEPERDVVLNFHWMETLRCSPGCRVEREAVDGDRVGFIRVPAPHERDFVIENSYEW
jgi:hypothetical protein